MNSTQKLLQYSSSSWKMLLRRHYSPLLPTTCHPAITMTTILSRPITARTCSCLPSNTHSSATISSRTTIPLLGSSSHHRQCSTAVIPPAAADDLSAGKAYPAHVRQIVDSISNLTLIEVAELNELLKIRLNIADAPMMPMGGMAMQQAAPTAPVEEEEAEAVVVQTEFAIHIKSFNDATRIKVIKEVKKIREDFNLVQAKKFVEAMPAVLKEGCDKEEAAALKAALEAVGAVIEVV